MCVLGMSEEGLTDDGETLSESGKVTRGGE